MEVAESEGEKTLRELEEKECKEVRGFLKLQVFVSGTFNESG